MKKTCMSCKFFKMEDTMSGYCRVQQRKSGDMDAPRPMVKQDYLCNQWDDCGQQYYIRIGWARSQNEKKEKKLHQQEE